MSSLKFDYPREFRLRLNKEIQKTLREGKVSLTSYFVVFYRKNEMNHSRFGVAVKKKFGKANRRNKIKRYLREYFRLNKSDFPSGYDYFILPRRKLSVEFEGLDFESTSKKINDIVRKINESLRSA